MNENLNGKEFKGRSRSALVWNLEYPLSVSPGTEPGTAAAIADRGGEGEEAGAEGGVNMIVQETR